MGACGGKQDKSTPESSKNSALPEFHYLYREKGRILFISQNGVKKIDFVSKMDFPKDSAVQFLQEGSFLVAGGTRNSEFLTEVYLANPESKQISIVRALPIPVMGGNLHEHGSWVYLVAGIIKGESSVESSPLMRYSPSQDTWEVFQETFVNDEELRKQLNDGEQSEVSSVQSKRDFKLKNLLNAGSFLMGDKIYFVGGQRKASRGELKSSQYVYSLDLSDDQFLLRMEPVKMQFKVINPKIAASANHAVLVGGRHPHTGEYNKNVFEFRIDETGPKFNKIDGLNFELEEHYPAIGTASHSIFVSFPSVAVRKIGVGNWFVFSIEHRPAEHSKSPEKKVKGEDKEKKKKKKKNKNKKSREELKEENREGSPEAEENDKEEHNEVLAGDNKEDAKAGGKPEIILDVNKTYEKSPTKLPKPFNSRRKQSSESESNYTESVCADEGGEQNDKSLHASLNAIARKSSSSSSSSKEAGFDLEVAVLTGKKEVFKEMDGPERDAEIEGNVDIEIAGSQEDKIEGTVDIEVPSIDVKITASQDDRVESKADIEAPGSLAGELKEKADFEPLNSETFDLELAAQTEKNELFNEVNVPEQDAEIKGNIDALISGNQELQIESNVDIEVPGSLTGEVKEKADFEVPDSEKKSDIECGEIKENFQIEERKIEDVQADIKVPAINLRKKSSSSSSSSSDKGSGGFDLRLDIHRDLPEADLGIDLSCDRNKEKEIDVSEAQCPEMHPDPSLEIQADINNSADEHIVEKQIDQHLHSAVPVSEDLPNPHFHLPEENSEKPLVHLHESKIEDLHPHGSLPEVQIEIPEHFEPHSGIDPCFELDEKSHPEIIPQIPDTYIDASLGLDTHVESKEADIDADHNKKTHPHLPEGNLEHHPPADLNPDVSEPHLDSQPHHEVNPHIPEPNLDTGADLELHSSIPKAHTGVHSSELTLGAVEPQVNIHPQTEIKSHQQEPLDTDTLIEVHPHHPDLPHTDVHSFEERKHLDPHSQTEINPDIPEKHPSLSEPHPGPCHLELHQTEPEPRLGVHSEISEYGVEPNLDIHAHLGEHPHTPECHLDVHSNLPELHDANTGPLAEDIHTNIPKIHDGEPEPHLELHSAAPDSNLVPEDHINSEKPPDLEPEILLGLPTPSLPPASLEARENNLSETEPDFGASLNNRKSSSSDSEKEEPGKNDRKIADFPSVSLKDKRSSSNSSRSSQKEKPQLKDDDSSSSSTSKKLKIEVKI